MKMDLSSHSNNNNSCKGSKVNLGGIGHRDKSIPSKSSKGDEDKGKSEQVVKVKAKKKLRYEKQQENKSPGEDSLHCPILLASNSNPGSNSSARGDGGGSPQDFSPDWWMEDTSPSCFTTEDGSGKGNLPGSGAGNSTRKVDNKIDSDVAAVESQGGFGREQNSPGTTTEASSSSLYHHLARVDPIVDFFTVDEELLGRFRICSCLPHQIRRNGSSSSSSAHGSGGGSGGGEAGIRQQQAIIFKIKTTSPYSFWVRPIYGLMRPNVMAWVDVKCELKTNSLAKLVQNMDEFLVEVCPVPGAISTMTSDFYTSGVHSNFPELVNIWERVEQELKENQQQLQGFVKEFHRVSCRFQRSSLSSPVQSLHDTISIPKPVVEQQEKFDNNEHAIVKEDAHEETNNNNAKIFQWNPFDSAQDECYLVAREFPSHYNHQSRDENNSIPAHRSRFREENSDHDDSGGKAVHRCSCCSSCTRAVGKVGCLSFILAFLLFASLAFIFYSQYYHYNYFQDNNSNNAKKNVHREAYNDKNNNNNNYGLLSTNHNKRDFNQ